ncbi:MAG TPA: hypothetical protein VFS30_18285 [Dehalococcoidia bacterium]|nr:hypothetical protein [Dehalococcoidia bacterium]
MEHKKSHLHLVADNATDADLDIVAAAIRPVPPEVEPSEEFLGELRLRLLKLEPRRAAKAASKRAA